jgi:hypothetical protein
MDFGGDLYGQRVRVEFVQRIRDIHPLHQRGRADRRDEGGRAGGAGDPREGWSVNVNRAPGGCPASLHAI